MARLLIDARSVTVSLSGSEKAEALHGDLRLARSQIVGARVVADGSAEVLGLPAGAEMSGRGMVGTWREPGRTTFAVCYGRRPAVVLDLVDSSHDRVVVTVDHPEQVVYSLGR